MKRILLISALLLTTQLNCMTEDVTEKKDVYKILEELKQTVKKSSEKIDSLETHSSKIKEFLTQALIKTKFEKVMQESITKLNEKLDNVLSKNEQSEIVDEVIEQIENEDVIYKPEEVLEAARKPIRRGRSRIINR